MTLSAAQKSAFAKATKLGAGKQGVGLTDGTCTALLAIAARDLDTLPDVAKLAVGVELYADAPPSALEVSVVEAPIQLFDRLVSTGVLDVDTYFSCLSALHKGRLKYERILATQPVPTIDQVGPRGLLLYGLLPAPALAALLLSRKWVFDVDNRAGQETGYVFEGVLAGAIGGTPASSKNSPVRRRNNKAKGRQVDCIVEAGNLAYEFKMRVTIAASGQGRWREELDFPLDCEASGFTPVLVVLDPTDDPKLSQLRDAFVQAGGVAYIGDDAWDHLEAAAGPTMGRFVEKYIRAPLADLLANTPDPSELPSFGLELQADSVTFVVGSDRTAFRRDAPDPDLADDDDELPDDISDQLPGV